MQFPNCCIVQFAKVPIAGHVKTRLIPAIGKQGALQLHKKLLTHTWQSLNAEKLASMQLWVDQIDTTNFFANLQPTVAPLQIQQGVDLGERMSNVIKQALQQSEAVVLVGSDCPVLDGPYVCEAFQSLQQGNDVVLGPASDGGYVLIGMRRLYAKVFQGINWGTGQVLEQTRERLVIAGCRWTELEERWDVDRPEDLAKLASLRFF